MNIAADIVEAVSEINSALTVLMSACDWKDVDNARRAISARAGAISLLAEKVAEL